MNKAINKFVLNLILKHYGKDLITYKSSLHTHFLEDGVKTRGRFNIMFCLLLAIQKYCDKVLGITNINISEDSKSISIDIKLNKTSKLFLFKGNIEDDLSCVFKKETKIHLQYTEKLYGLKYYGVI